MPSASDVSLARLSFIALSLALGADGVRLGAHGGGLGARLGDLLGRIRSNQKQSEATRSNQKQSEAIGSNRKQPEAIRSNQKRSEAIRSDQKRSEGASATCSAASNLAFQLCGRPKTHASSRSTEMVGAA